MALALWAELQCFVRHLQFTFTVIIVCDVIPKCSGFNFQTVPFTVVALKRETFRPHGSPFLTGSPELMPIGIGADPSSLRLACAPLGPVRLDPTSVLLTPQIRHVSCLLFV